MPTKIPPGVDPGLWAEFQQVHDEAIRLHQQRDLSDEGVPAPPVRRIVLDLPEEQFLLFAWLAGRHRKQRAGQDGPTGLTPDTIRSHEAAMRRVVRSYAEWCLSEEFHAELDQLATGASPWLRPSRPQLARTLPDLDDDLPI